MTEKNKGKKIQAIRGMNDRLPTETATWRYVEEMLKQILNSYGYNEIRTPIVEETGLFKRAVGEATDIVEKEMYTFDDRNNESLTLRPELTAGCVRAGIEHGLFYNQEQRLWCLGPAFRYERPQKGRYRQFHQFGVEVFGLTGPDIDAEILLITARLWRALGLEDHVTLELNSLGSPEERTQYCNALITFLECHKDKLDEDGQRRMYSNPLRVLDSKNPDIQVLLNGAPKLADYFSEDTLAHFEGLCRLLDATGVKYRLNPRLVRGLDYYNRTVFEWVTTDLGAQGTVCAGGRYDGLVAQLGGQDTAGIGFAIGMERLILLIQTVKADLSADNGIDIYLISAGDEKNRLSRISNVQALAETLRNTNPALRVMTNYGDGNFKKQFRRADKLGAMLAVVVGDDEFCTERALVKNLTTGSQMTVDQNELVSMCLNALGKIKGEV